MINLQTAVQYLLENGYMVKLKGGYRVTAKFNQEMTGKKEGLIVHKGKAAVIEQQLPGTEGVIDWTQAYLRFIKEAQVPSRCENNHGSSYDVNKYSEEGMKAFRKILEVEKVPYQHLVLATRLYYTTHKKHAVKVGNYIAQGVWRSDVEGLVTSAENGTLDQHIHQEMKNDAEFSRYTTGFKTGAGKLDVDTQRRLPQSKV